MLNSRPVQEYNQPTILLYLELTPSDGPNIVLVIGPIFALGCFNLKDLRI